MQHRIIHLVALTALLAAGPLYAQDSGGEAAAGSGKERAEKSKDADKKIYKVREEDGSVTFTDEPPSGRASEEVELRQGNDLNMQAPPATPGTEPEEDKEKELDYELRITSPKPEETFQHPTDPVPVKYSVKPALQPGHAVELMHNGERMGGQALQWPQRGTHRVQARIVDNSGKVLEKSEERTFYVHRPSRKLPPNTSN